MILGLVRLGGAGLGNLLFIFAHAAAFAKRNRAELIWPTWSSIKVGPWIRRERDKRFYGGLFKNDGNYIGGLKKIALLLFGKKHIVDNIDVKTCDRDGVTLYTGYRMCFGELLDDREQIKSSLYGITRRNNLLPLKHDFTNEINMHVRLGDFIKADIAKLNAGDESVSTPIAWFVKTINDVRKVLGDTVKFNVFSDGTDEELKDLLSMDGVSRMYYGNAWADIIGLAQSKVIIASGGSTFSMWARFLGNSACITFTNQIRGNLCSRPNGFDFAYGLEDKFPDDLAYKIKALYISDKQL